MIYGYARVSTNHQDTELQLTALKSAGCEKIFEEHASGRKSNRPVLKRLIATMQPGDELVVWKLDRIGRNVLHALLMFQQLQENCHLAYYEQFRVKTFCYAKPLSSRLSRM